MSDLISRESLKQRINLNYNNHQYIDTQSIKDIINTEPSVEDKTVEELENIKEEIIKFAFLFDDLSPDKELVVDLDNIEEVIDNHIKEWKGEAE